MKKLSHIRAFLLLAVTTFFLTACGTMLSPRTLTFTNADFARLLEQQGPLQRRMLEVLDVRINRPTVRLIPETNRLSSSFDVAATERISRTTLNGKIALDYALRYDEAEKAIRMTNVKVNDFRLNDVSPEKARGVKNLGSLIAEQVLENLVVYRFKPNDLRNAEGKGYRPGAVTVTSRGVEVTLAPM